MRNNIFVYFIIGWAILLPIALYIQSQVWNECRASGHSFFYCMNLINGK